MENKNYITDENVQKLADELGVAMAAAAPLNAKVKQIKSELYDYLEAGERAKGSLWEVLHVETDRKTTAWKTIAERLEASRQMIAANTKKSTVDSIKITALQG